ncbi:MAG: hypothetical protein QNI98_08390 [Woeseiaceae bacterium]|nr:hypothetical protein [Woeseiaceae bacterium]
MFKNKHMIVAMLVAPVLAIMAWFAVDYFVAERPHAAKPGSAYTLIAKSNCRYASGQCDLENADFKLSIRPGMVSASSVALTLTASHELQSAAIGLFNGDEEQASAPMTRTDDAGTEWQGLLPSPGSDESRIRIAVTANGAIWSADVPVVFISTSN